MRLRFPSALWHHRELWWRLTEREVLGRYRGSALGIGWSFITPLAMLAVYTFVFSQVFKARWGDFGTDSGTIGFAINLFAGLIVFNLFSECANRAPGLILANPNYVKKVIFPLEVLGSVALGTAGFHAVTSLMVLIAFQLAAFRSLPITILWLPLVWLPLVLISLATTWILSSLGVFLRDIGQIISLGLNVLMFLSPVFFPISALPPKMLPFLQLNPLAQVIEQTRTVAIAGEGPSLKYLVAGILIGAVACEISFRGFQKAKRAFADVL
jgi:lipopolysaccharide transport system permease protein